ncbi:threonine aldolase family protein [Salinarimonas soli]|uniref:L-threonine aldolase n=1 Tax=Salinarimonas soli TaxID=1638099 RepID=A0A5B2VD01_9HYPH|nr:low specificity L-threonine aldolase [Salinarimonas soli]KAA2236556.1 low specificity L-threonine aldolase [Salinarimonas soli]
MNFASDNVMGASRPVLEALVAANDGPMPAYGADPLTARVEAAFCGLFEREVAVSLVATGTGANALALSALVPPYGLAVCHAEAHIIDDECGAPEFFMHGAKLAGLPGVGAKLAPDTVAAYLDGLSRSVKQMPPRALSISQVTECGLVYTPDEIRALADVAHARGLAVHMDGARFANALVALGCRPAEITWKAGVDVLTFGATKNGCLAAEAVIFFDPAQAESMPWRRKRSGHTLSKGRLLSAQLDAYLADSHWLANARHANAMAACLSQGLCERPGVRLAWATQANEVFAILPRSLDEALRAAGAVYHPWTPSSLPPDERVAEDEVLVRLVTSFATSPEMIDRLLAVAHGRRVAAE